MYRSRSVSIGSTLGSSLYRRERLFSELGVEDAVSGGAASMAGSAAGLRSRQESPAMSAVDTPEVTDDEDRAEEEDDEQDEDVFAGEDLEIFPMSQQTSSSGRMKLRRSASTASASTMAEAAAAAIEKEMKQPQHQQRQQQRQYQHQPRKSSSCLLYTSPSPRDATLSRMPSSA